MKPSVPTEMVREWQHEAWVRVTGDLEQLIYIVERAAAYGREQAHSDIRISPDQWAELVARHPETMQVLFGGQP